MKLATRIEEHKKQFTTLSEDKYLKSEVLPNLYEFRNEVLNILNSYGFIQKQNPTMNKVFKYLDNKNKEFGCCADEALLKFKKNCEAFDTILGREKSGTRGEELAKRALFTIRRKHFDLHNIELKDGNNVDELDSVVFTENGIFLIEVKNSSHDMIIDEKGNYYRKDKYQQFDYNIGEKVNNKEYLLRKTLLQSGLISEDKINIKTIVCMANSKMDIENHFPHFECCYLSQLPHIIGKYKGNEIYSFDKAMRMANFVKSSESKNEYPLDFDVNSFITNLSTILALFDEAVENGHLLQNINLKEELSNRLIERFFKPLSLVLSDILLLFNRRHYTKKMNQI